MNKIYVIDYDENILGALKNKRLVVNLNSSIDILSQYKNCIRNNEVIAMILTLPYTSISQLEFDVNWEDIPLIVKLYNIGCYEFFLTKTSMIRSLNIRFLLSCKSEAVCSDLKILASLGIDCGIDIETGCVLNDDKLLDLASYYYLSPVQHATIEPFEFILRHVVDEVNSNFNEAYFNNPLLHKRICSTADLNSFCEEKENDLNIKMDTYYSHFMQLDECSKCSAFKICNKQMKDCLSDCQHTMAEIFEYAELRSEINNNKVVKTICQL